MLVRLLRLGRDILLRRLNGLILLYLGHMRTPVRDIVAKHSAELLAVIGEQLRIVGAARYGDVGSVST